MVPGTTTVFHDGDVVQTQIPYDDFPITLARIGGEWQALTPILPVHAAVKQGDDTIEEWIGEGAAEVKVKQDHQFSIRSGPDGYESYGECHIGCGVAAEDAFEDAIGVTL